MSAHDPRVTLHQIQDAARLAQSVCAGKTLEGLLKDPQATAALERFIEIMGEAVKRLPMDLRNRHPGVPWKEIAGTRDHLIHGYDDVDYQVLWDAVEKDMPQILDAVGQMLKDL
ncbi:MAG: DUF86 domain-containing protein [Verrucomicrobiae bacterium]|nr:DUF86 domain-containing protein [Verrucomicrobiae bacterium]